jgi:hypothetical protein
MPVIRAARESLMPAYAFEIRWSKGEKTGWTYFPTDGQARDFARILIQNFKNGGQYTGAAQMVVKNDEGGSIATFQF